MLLYKKLLLMTFGTTLVLLIFSSPTFLVRLLRIILFNNVIASEFRLSLRTAQTVVSCLGWICWLNSALTLVLSSLAWFSPRNVICSEYPCHSIWSTLYSRFPCWLKAFQIRFLLRLVDCTLRQQREHSNSLYCDKLLNFRPTVNS